MRVYKDLNNTPSQHANQARSIAIGNFDGVHRGHQHLLQSVREKAEAEGYIPAVLTFDPHPVECLRPEASPARLSLTDEKLEKLEAIGISEVWLVPFSEEISQLSPEAFYTQFLKDGFSAKSLHVGFNFAFGKGRSGSTTELQLFCDRDEVSLTIAQPVYDGGEVISSSRIRRALEQGDVEAAGRLLGSWYAVQGEVTRGDGRGASMGFPTANLLSTGRKLIPKSGVYVTRTTLEGQTVPSVTNIGVQPTFGDSRPRVVETHLLGHEQNVHGKPLSVQFLARLRDERKFPSATALKAQIENDVGRAERHFQLYPDQL